MSDYDYCDDYNDDNDTIDGIEFEETFDPDGYTDDDIQDILGGIGTF